ncbi:hypothetical protein GGR51DRAFT_513989 [Nemania sp. FL0031]|nr:hypothetical protein GGR51DRAFT_513989 [Nemania sp. FL0031]
MSAQVVRRLEIMAEIRMEPLVRKYSLQLTDTGILPKSLVAVAETEKEHDRKRDLALREWQDWVRFDETPSDPRLKELTSRGKLLVDSWRTFGSLFDVDGVRYGAWHSVPTIDSLFHAINDANAEWELNKQTRVGRAKEHFLHFMNTLNDYSFLFSVIPHNDKYTSLITGVLSSIAKAAIKYQEISEKIAHALDRITFDIRQVQKYTKIASTAEICDLVVEFYVRIFELLCSIMSWYSSRAKRLIGSFTKSFNKELDGEVDAIQQVLKKLSEETALITQSRVYDLCEGIVGISSKIETTDSRLQNIEAILQDFAARIVLSDVGQAATQHLNSICRQSIENGVVASTSFAGHPTTGYVSPIADKADGTLPTLSSDYQATDGTATLLSKLDLLECSRKLKPFLDDRRNLISKSGGPSIRSVLPSEVVREMQSWMANPSSGMLWVSGISSYSPEPILSTAALHICSIAASAGIPCVSYFCRTLREHRKVAQRNRSLTHAEAACVSLLYSIITQLCENLPDDLTGTEGFDHRFKLLDGSLDSSKIAIGLIKDLFVYLPPLTVWILDGFPFAGTKSTVPYIAELIRLLRTEDRGRVTKVLYTTEGNTHWLADNLEAGEHFSASRMAQNKPGRLMPGVMTPLFSGTFRDRQE